MQLIKKMFGRPAETSPAPGSESAQFQESDNNSESGSRNAPRRELVQVVLRDSMRRHGIPSSWIDCRTLSVVTRSQRTGMHVQFIVRDGIDRLLTYVPAFQTSFLEEIARFDPRVDDWLFSVSWQFLHFNAKVPSLMPDPAMWAGTTAGVPLQVQSVAATAPVALQPVAATPAPMAAPTPAATPGPTRASASTTPATPTAAAVQAGDDEVMEDLQALYATMRLGRGNPTPGPAADKDFESTHPGDEPDAAGPPLPKRW
jgi:hypothetical protein